MAPCSRHSAAAAVSGANASTAVNAADVQCKLMALSTIVAARVATPPEHSGFPVARIRVARHRGSGHNRRMPDAPIPITASLALDPAEIEVSFIRSPGPGGQNVNKVASGAQLRFDLMGSPSLPDAVKARAASLAGSRLTTDGAIVITATRF